MKREEKTINIQKIQTNCTQKVNEGQGISLNKFGCSGYNKVKESQSQTKLEVDDDVWTDTVQKTPELGGKA
jgi:hypothetical protein